jgi:hypothetical protein
LSASISISCSSADNDAGSVPCRRMHQYPDWQQK